MTSKTVNEVQEKIKKEHGENSITTGSEIAKKSEQSQPTNLVQAVLNVMDAVKNIDKNLNVGAGGSSYKGVADKDVKQALGKAMKDNGLIAIPISIEPTLRIDRWEEDAGKYGIKQKQSVFTEVLTKYKLIHISGESMEIVGYGHGVDSQDKSAGKATTYALKNALLYTFLVPTGAIDDTDTEHSESKPVPKKPVKKAIPMISKQQVAEVKTLMDQKGVTKEKLKAHIEKNYKLDSMAKMTSEQATKLIGGLSKMDDIQPLTIDEEDEAFLNEVDAGIEAMTEGK